MVMVTRRAAARRKAARVRCAAVAGWRFEPAYAAAAPEGNAALGLQLQTLTMLKTKAARKRFPNNFNASATSAAASRHREELGRGSSSSSSSGSDTSPCSSPRDGDGTAPTPARRPIRPVDRQKMLDWLLDKLNRKEMEKSLWWAEKGRIFCVRWPHAASHTFSTSDARLFKAWAEHTGIYKAGDLEADHRKWKANFRCAIHSLPDLKEIKKKDGRKGPNASRVYEILENPQRKKKTKTTRGQTASDEEKEDKGDNFDNGTSAAVDAMGDLPLTVSSMLETDVKEENNIPNFSSLGVGGMIIQQNHLSGGCIVKQEAPPSPGNTTTTTTSTSSSSSTTTPFCSQYFSFPSPSTSRPHLFPSSTTTTTTTTATTATNITAPTTTSSSSSSSSVFPFFSSSSSSSSSFSFPSYLSSFPQLSLSGSTTATTTSTKLSQQDLEDLEDLGDMEDMVPVGIMVTGRDHRSPSGDSGMPASPLLEMGEKKSELRQQEEEVTAEEFQQIIVDEGIDLKIVSSSISPLEDGQNLEQWTAVDILDISDQMPEGAMAMEEVLGDGHFITMTTQMLTAVGL